MSLIKPLRKHALGSNGDKTFDTIGNTDAFLAAMEFLEENEESSSLKTVERRMFLLFVAEALRDKNTVDELFSNDIMDYAFVVQ